MSIQSSPIYSEFGFESSSETLWICRVKLFLSVLEIYATSFILVPWQAYGADDDPQLVREKTINDENTIFFHQEREKTLAAFRSY